MVDSNPDAHHRQNWRIFIARHVKDWHGLWTRYTPQGEVMQSFQSLRSFKIGNSEKTLVKQTNRYTYSDGSTQEKAFEYSMGSTGFTDNRSTGFVGMKVAFFESGHGVSLAVHLNHTNYTGVEIFFRHEETIRHSTAIGYNERKLVRVSSVREDSSGYPGKHWSMEVKPVSERIFTGNWEGTSVTQFPDLTISEPVQTQLQWGWEGHQVLYLPDGITVSCPREIIEGTPVDVVASWLVTDTKMHQMRIKYDSNGYYMSQTLDVLELKN